MPPCPISRKGISPRVARGSSVPTRMSPLAREEEPERPIGKQRWIGSVRGTKWIRCGIRGPRGLSEGRTRGSSIP